VSTSEGLPQMNRGGYVTTFMSDRNRSSGRRALFSRRTFAAAALSAPLVRAAVPDRTVILTMDDAVKSHRTFAAPLLKELGFRATFFVTHDWMPDREHFMNWNDIAELHRMGFEIGNHSWTHADFSSPRHAARLAGELALVENELQRVGVPRPVSFAYCGNSFGPEAVAELQKAGYRFARRGEMPEAPYGQPVVGAAYDVRRHHRLLIPTTGDAYPNWTFEHFQSVISHAREGRIVVLQFHGVPDTVHPWVHTPPEMFERYMRHLRDQNFRVIALRDVEPYLPAGEPADPLLADRFPRRAELALPTEMLATRADLPFWLSNIVRAHHYTAAEAAAVCGKTPAEVSQIAAALPRQTEMPGVLPYPGGRPLRIGFQEGAINPLRGTKTSVFLPWDPASYVVIDLPEAIFSNLGLLFLAHTHVPTIWNQTNVVIENTDWVRAKDGLRSEWKLPNGVGFGAQVQSAGNRIEMELWLRNGTVEPLQNLRTQICVLLKEAAGFNGQSNTNKSYQNPEATVRSADGKRSIVTAWERCGRTWGNTACPCMHSDPVLPDCAPGETVRLRGYLLFRA
jgi:peptidoglycan/xylan/chitin deacetylase (PgdA/CDA1 family)